MAVSDEREGANRSSDSKQRTPHYTFFLDYRNNRALFLLLKCTRVFHQHHVMLVMDTNSTAFFRGGEGHHRAGETHTLHVDTYVPHERNSALVCCTIPHLKPGGYQEKP